MNAKIAQQIKYLTEIENEKSNEHADASALFFT